MLAGHFTVVTADLRGYGASSKPEGVENYTFREMGRDMAALMAALGHDRFDLAGHDRGARVAHRMALDDDAGRIGRLVLMDIVPTHHLLCDLTRQVAASYYHWFSSPSRNPFPRTADPVRPRLFLRKLPSAGRWQKAAGRFRCRPAGGLPHGLARPEDRARCATITRRRQPRFRAG
ncbi:MAG: alpha/beta fold hydrolase [Defluviimonas denitrificans]